MVGSPLIRVPHVGCAGVLPTPNPLLLPGPGLVPGLSGPLPCLPTGEDPSMSPAQTLSGEGGSEVISLPHAGEPQQMLVQIDRGHVRGGRCDPCHVCHSTGARSPALNTEHRARLILGRAVLWRRRVWCGLCCLCSHRAWDQLVRSLFCFVDLVLNIGFGQNCHGPHTLPS